MSTSGPPDATDLPLPSWGPVAAVRPLGEGATGRVWLARDTVLDRLVAVKVLSPTAGRALEADSSARREGRLLSRLSHPHVVTVHQFGAAGDQRWLIMEYVDGGDLGARLQTGSGPGPSAAIRLIRRVAGALAHAHAQGIVHRDIKPQNVLLSHVGGDRWWPKVADLGLARVAPDLAATSIGPGHGGLVGTPLYMAPEQVTGGEADGRADVYALALLTWELLAGRHPYQGCGAVEVMLRQTREVVPPLSEALPAAAPLDGVLARALAKAPGERTGDAARFAEELEAAAAQAGWGGRGEAVAEERRPATVAVSAHQAAVVLAASVAVTAPGGGRLYRGEHDEALEHLLRRVARCVDDAGGRVVACLGDELLALFRADATSGVERALDAALAVRELLAGAEADPTLDVAVSVRGSVGVDVGAVLLAPWLGEVAVVQGEAVDGARALCRGALAVHATLRAARQVGPGYRLERHGDQARVLGREPATPGGAMTSLPFAGRAAELAVLGAAATDAEELRAAHLVLVLGEGGAGKTRLVDEALARSVAANCGAGAPRPTPGAGDPVSPERPGDGVVLRGRCPAAGTGSPFAPLAEALGPLVEAAGGGGDARDAHLAARLLFGVGPRDPGDPPRHGERAAAFAAVAGVLAARLRLGPVALVVDDADAATEATLDLLSHLLDALADTPLLVVVLARATGALDGLRVPVERLRVVRLAGLRAPEVAELVRAVLGEAPADVIRSLAEASGGHPLLLEELLERVRRGDRAEALPSALDAAVLGRVDALGPEEAEALLRHAVCGDVAWTGLIARARPGAGAGVWRTLRAAGFLVDARDDRIPGEPVTRFRHGLVREIVYRNLPPRWRREEHRRAAEWLEVRDAPSALVAHHAALCGDWVRAARASYAAGVAAQRVHAAAEALGWLERAVEHGARCPDGPGVVQVVRDALLAGALACAFTPTPDEALRWLERAEQDPLATRPEGLATHRARAAIRRAEIGELLGRFDDALAALERAEDFGAGDALLRLVAASRRAMVLARRGRLAEAEPVARGGLDRLGSPPEPPADRAEWHRAAGALWAALGHVTCRTGRLAEGRAAYEESRRHWDQTGWPAAAATAQLNLGLAAWWAGDRAEARARWERAVEGFSASTAMHGLATALTNLGELELLEGRLVVAEERLCGAEHVLRALGTRDVLPETLRLRAEVGRGAGRLDAAERLALQAIALAEEVGSPGFLGAAERTLAGVLTDAGRPGEARAALVRARAAWAAAGQERLVAEADAALAAAAGPAAAGEP